jgi:hypothetical protein
VADFDTAQLRDAGQCRRLEVLPARGREGGRFVALDVQVVVVQVVGALAAGVDAGADRAGDVVAAGVGEPAVTFFADHLGVDREGVAIDCHFTLAPRGATDGQRASRRHDRRRTRAARSGSADE